MTNNNETKAGFVHPADFGMAFPINTPKELCNIANAINAGNRRRVGVITKDAEGKPEYKKVNQ
jgi:hypothetical protein